MASAPAVIVNLPGYPFQNFPSLPTLSALRAVSPTGLLSGDNFVVDGRTSVGDGLGGIYTWNPSSTATDDNFTIVRPNALTAGQAGRWILSPGTPLNNVAHTDTANTFAGRQSAPGFDAIAASGNAANQIRGQAGTYRYEAAQTGGLNRWAWGADDAAENGSNAGSNYFLSRYGDNGVEIDRPIKGSRKTGAILIKDYACPITYFGAVADSDCTPGSGTDNLAAFNAAITSGVRTIFIPAAPAGKAYRLSNTWNLTRSVQVIGEGSVPQVGGHGTRGEGSWLYCDHTTVGAKLYNFDVGQLTGGHFSGVGFIRNQPAFAAGWAPGPNDFDIQCLQGEWYIDDICFWNSTNALRADYGGEGRMRVGHVYGNPYRAGIVIDRQYDVVRIDSVHFWPYNTFDTYSQAYKYANFVPLEVGHVDGLVIHDFFAINGFRNYFRLGADGLPPNDVQIDHFYCDLFGYAGILVDANAAGGSINIDNLQIQGAVSADNNPGGAYAGIVLNAPSFIMKVDAARYTRFNQQAVLVTGNSTNFYQGPDTLNQWNMAGVGASAYAVTGTGSRIIKTALSTVVTSGGAIGDGSGKVYEPTFHTI